MPRQPASAQRQWIVVFNCVLLRSLHRRNQFIGFLWAAAELQNHILASPFFTKISVCAAIVCMRCSSLNTSSLFPKLYQVFDPTGHYSNTLWRYLQSSISDLKPKYFSRYLCTSFSRGGVPSSFLVFIEGGALPTLFLVNLQGGVSRTPFSWYL